MPMKQDVLGAYVGVTKDPGLLLAQCRDPSSQAVEPLKQVPARHDRGRASCFGEVDHHRGVVRRLLSLTGVTVPEGACGAFGQVGAD